MPYFTDDEQWFHTLVVVPDDTTAPSWRFGKYLHPSKPRAALRQSEEGRRVLLETLQLFRNGHSHEKESDVAPFVFWDGEGITYEEGTPQSYVLFGSSLGHEVCDKRLRTEDCLDLIIQAERDMPHSAHVAFAFNYDAEMILADLPLRHWFVLRKHGSVTFGSYHITYHPGRMFRVTKKIDGQKYTATIYDTFGFFQMSFVKALRTWLDDEELQEIDSIEKGKDARGAFTYAELDGFIRPYWQSELRLGVVLMDRLRERLSAADVCPNQWYGAGAIATTLYRRHHMRHHLSRTDRYRHEKDRDIHTVLPEGVSEASRFAYAGGRFELFRLGHTDEKVYQYDIRSAYPCAIATLPSLANARWHHQVSPNFDHRLFAVWRIEYDNWTPYTVLNAGPLFHRDWAGRVAYPQTVSGWYWTPEATLIANDPNATIVECWYCEHDDDWPFAWVKDLYNERQRRKAQGDPSEKGLKLALNSLYGKMAQRLGWEYGRPLPAFHQLEWAGWVTSYTRMSLYVAMREAGRNLIATETDSVFTTQPLPNLNVGTGLGEWELTEHDWITYLQSGTYWTDKGAKYRGFDPDSLQHDDAMAWLRRQDFATPLVGTTTRFVGAGRGLGTPLHRTWLREARDVMPGKSGKRVHVADACAMCADGVSPADALHPLICITRGGASQPHHLPWVDDLTPNIAPWDEITNVESWDHFN